MFSTLFQPCELRLHLLQNAIFMHPPDRALPESHDRPPQANDELVRGLVELYVPTNRHIAGIRVRLKAVQTVAILDAATGINPISWEDTTVLERVVEIGIHHQEKDRPPHSQQQPAGRSASLAAEERGRSAASGSRGLRGSSAFGLRSHSPGGSIPASMARAVSRGRMLATGMGRISHSPSPSNSRHGSRATSPAPPHESERGRSTTSRHPSAFHPPLAPDQALDASGHPHLSAPISVPHTPESEQADISYPASMTATPQLSRRPSLSGGDFASSQPEPDLPDLPPPDYESSRQADAELAAQLHRSLAVHAEEANTRRRPGALPSGPVRSASSSSANDVRSSSVTPSQSRQRDGSVSGKGKSRSTSVGWASDLALFGHKGKSSRSKSRASAASKGTGSSHVGELDDVDEEQQVRGRSGRTASRRGRAGDEGASSAVNSHDSATDGGGDHSESGWETEAKAEGLELQKGVHGFEFAFIIPCDSPPYERSPYGRVRYIVKATAIGAGRAKSNVECWRDLYPMVNPSPDSGPTPLAVLYNDLHPTVGLVGIACTSNNISVGGVFNIDVNSPAPPPDLIVYLVRVSLETTIELQTKKRGKQTVPVQRHKVFEKGWVPAKNADGSHGDGKASDGFVRNRGNDHAWTVQGVARMPDDNTIRASTSGGTKASIRFSHVLVVEIVHSRRAGTPSDAAEPATDGTGTGTETEAEVKWRKLKVFALRQPVLIPSCCCAYDAVTLPAYTADPDPGARRADMPYDVGHLRHASSLPSATFPPSSPSPSSSPLPPTASGAGPSNGPGSGSGSGSGSGGPHGSIPRHEAASAGLYGSTDTAQRISGKNHLYCVCGMTLQQLSEQERALLPSGPIEVQDGVAFQHRGKIGELPPSFPDEA